MTKLQGNLRDTQYLNTSEVQGCRADSEDAGVCALLTPGSHSGAGGVQGFRIAVPAAQVGPHCRQHLRAQSLELRGHKRMHGHQWDARIG